MLAWFGPDQVRTVTEPGIDAPSFAEFAHATLNFRLHPWQEQVLCPLIERLVHERSLRVLVHAPPQYGKSVLLSQRAPAWILGCDPLHRIGLAAYNETHAGGFGSVVRDLMLTPQYREQFPDARCRVRADAAAVKFFTSGRQAVNDAQPSFLALGLQSGFTGKGVDTLIIDDPYKSSAEAESEAINGNVWGFWKNTASVRIEQSANVVVMFHRYHLDDLAGRLLAEGGWEYIRLPAIADANEDASDPTGREAGELLSPKHSREWLRAQEETNSLTFLGQFQGRPAPPEGALFKVAGLQFVDVAPAGIRWVRAWDVAASAGKGDYTVGALMGVQGSGDEQRFFIANIHRGQWDTDRVDREIKLQAEMDGRKTLIHIPEDPAAAGKKSAAAFVRMLAGWPVKAENVRGDKITRARSLSSQVNGGNVYVVRGPNPERPHDWVAPMVEEMRAFPLGTHDDQIDALADAFNELTGANLPPKSIRAVQSPSRFAPGRALNW